ncbi:MAG: 30S ribosomal protein S18 [Verrucomicrobiota bacterium]|nr:30S ribosomal protein S18 [Verrucomicrobiota bacterium]
MAMMKRSSERFGAGKRTRGPRDDKFRPRKRSRFLEGARDIDLNDTEFLRRFITDHGKILPARLTGATAKQQRLLRRGIARARMMGLLP